MSKLKRLLNKGKFKRMTKIVHEKADNIVRGLKAGELIDYGNLFDEIDSLLFKLNNEKETYIRYDEDFDCLYIRFGDVSGGIIHYIGSDYAVELDRHDMSKIIGFHIEGFKISFLDKIKDKWMKLI